jgi:hypothetical protein
MLCQGRRVVVVPEGEYRRRVVLGGWTRPEDVPALKAATGQTRRPRVDPPRVDVVSLDEYKRRARPADVTSLDARIRRDDLVVDLVVVALILVVARCLGGF